MVCQSNATRIGTEPHQPTNLYTSSGVLRQPRRILSSHRESLHVANVKDGFSLGLGNFQEGKKVAGWLGVMQQDPGNKQKCEPLAASSCRLVGNKRIELPAAEPSVSGLGLGLSILVGCGCRLLYCM